MKYFTIEPVAEAELGERAEILFDVTPRRIIRAHVYLFNFPESELIQAYPLFLVSGQLKVTIELNGITGGSFLSCDVEKAAQYDEFSESTQLPEMFCLEPVGEEGRDDLVFYTETEFKASNRFVEILRSIPHAGCVIKL